MIKCLILSIVLASCTAEQADQIAQGFHEAAVNYERDRPLREIQQNSEISNGSKCR